MALQHHVRIPFLFNGSPTSCLDLLSFWWLSNIVSGSPIFSVALWHCVRISYIFGDSPLSCPNPLVFSPTLRHCVWISYLFDDSPTSCLDPLSFQRLFDIVCGSPFFWVAIWNHVRILYRFYISLATCSDPQVHRRVSGIVPRSLSP